MRSLSSSPSPSPAAKRPGCLGTMLGLLGLGLLVGIGSLLWDALIEAPWAHSMQSLAGPDRDGRGTLTGSWVGEITSPSQQLHGVLWLQIERRQWGKAGRTSGVSGPSYPDFSGTARLCGLSMDPNTTGPRKLWGYANRDASHVHATISFAPGRVWNLGALDGAWNRAAGTLTLAGRLDSNGGTARGGTPADDRLPTTITLRRSTERGAFEQRCMARGVKLEP